jgi:hypothetical protein
MTKAEGLALKGEEDFTDDEWNYLMTMGHSEMREYNLAKSRNRGLLAHYKKQDKLSFEDWLLQNDEWLTQYAAESGADRELDYDREELEERLYEEYLNDKQD